MNNSEQKEQIRLIENLHSKAERTLEEISLRNAKARAYENAIKSYDERGINRHDDLEGKIKGLSGEIEMLKNHYNIQLENLIEKIEEV